MGKNLGSTKKNPSVGCIIVKNGSTKINSDNIDSGISITKKITPARIVYAALENTSLMFFNLKHWFYYL